MTLTKIALMAVKLIIVIALMYYLFFSGQLSFEKLSSSATDIASLGQGIIIMQAIICLTAFRWFLIVRVSNENSQFFDLYIINYIVAFAASFLPAIVGADAVRGYFAIKSTDANKTGIAMSVISDRLISLYGVLTAVVFSIPFIWQPIMESWALRYVAGVVVGLYLAAIGGFLFLGPIHGLVVSRPFFHTPGRGQRIKKLFLQAADSLMMYRQNLRVVCMCLGLSVVIQGLTGLCLLILSSSIGLNGLSYAAQIFSTSLTTIINVIPLTPNGIGVGEVAYDGFASQILGVDVVLGYASAFLAFRVLWIVNSLPGLVFYVAHNTQAKPEEVNTVE